MGSTIKSKTLALVALMVLTLFLCTGCFNYEQETYLNEDLSGRVEVCVFPNPKPAMKSVIQKIDTTPGVKKAMTDSVDKADVSFKFKMDEKDFLNMFNLDAVKNKTYKVLEREGISYCYFTAEFNDIRQLYKDKRMVDVTEDKGGLITYTEYFRSPEDVKKEEGTDKKDAGIFKDYRFKYVLHMPQDIVSANTDRIEKNTATWEMPFEVVAATKYFHITATMKGRNKFLRWLAKFRKKIATAVRKE